jgi:hypothetical protein
MVNIIAPQKAHIRPNMFLITVILKFEVYNPKSEDVVGTWRKEGLITLEHKVPKDK